MASFDFWHFALDLSERADRERFEQLPEHPLATLSYVHEYVHYLQSVSSLLCFNVLEQLITVGVAAACKLNGLSGPQTGISLMTLLNAVPDHAGRGDREIDLKFRTLADEMFVLTEARDWPYAGRARPWEFDECEVTHGTFKHTFQGFVTERNTFQPFTPLLAIEGVARCVDRWYARNAGFQGHEWEPGDEEREIYNGLRNLLLQSRYGNLISEANVAEVTVLVGSLALLTPHPDWSMRQMLDVIEQTRHWCPVAVIEDALRACLIRSGELLAKYFNETMDTVHHRNGAAIARSEFVPVFEQLQLIHRSTTQIVNGRGAFFAADVTWQRVASRMGEFSVPPVRLSDGITYQVAGQDCNRALHDMISLIHQKIF